MLQKWKNILINWVNCYFNTSNNKQQDINVQSLLNIISHLRENLNLDDSKSSVLEAHTIEEFILEKYPEFKFKNGTIEPTTEEEIYVVASLLLFFVCVISKDVDIKNAMCSKLSADDQEVILKFSKSLMECHLISYRDVQTAITEACGQEVASAHSSHSIISATPPALRSLHSEVRRLQAALDAERFDRNYLQEELARMNMKLEKLLKDKEKYKLDIVNLKAKISMCCGQETEQPGVNAVTEGSLKLTRQLQQLEERLVETQGQLDDAFYERDTYKTKVDTLKQERDKWLAVSQQETSQVFKLSEELEVERQQVQSLQDLVTELRQHNQLNRFDSSQLECDDPDTSIRSIQHNSSICSEVCANVVEVQLGEERAKIVALKQQLQTLQDQLNELNQKSEQDKQAMELIICEKELEIVNLKHRVNEELEEQNNLKSHFNDEISKLNNEINEMEQQLKYNTEQSRRVLEKKMDEIRILQEEKISLLHSLSDETTKLDNIIKSLRTDLDTEKNTKISMKEDYENHIMKLNEKVLNRNNELVELQNNLLQNSEQLEYLHAEVRKERQIKQDLINKHCMELQQFNEKQNLTDNILKQKTNEIEQLQKKLELNLTCTEKLHNDISNLELKISDLGDNCRSLEDNKLALLQEIRNRDAKIEEIQKEVENVDNIFKEEQEKWLFEKDEKSVTINALQMQLQNEIDFKMQLQNELTQLQNNRISLLDNVNRLNLELEDSKKELEIKEQTIVGMDIYLHEEKQKNVKMTKENDELQEKVKVMSDDIAVKEITTKDIQNILLEKKRFYEDEIRNKDALIECEHHKLVDALEEKNTVQSELISITNEKQKLEKELNEKYTEVLQFKAEYTKMIQIVEEKNSTIGALTTKSEQHAISLKAMETSAICNETELKEARDNICMLKQQIKSLQDQLEKSSKKSKHDRHEMELCISEKETEILNLKHHINKVSEEKSKIEVITKDEVTKLNSKLNELELKHKESIKEFTHVIETKTHELKVAQEEKMSLLKNLSHENNKLEEIVKTLKVDFDVERNAKISMNEEYENRITSLNQTILDRNNELVELQNNLFEKTEMLEKLHIEIKRESQRNLDISNKHHDELESLCEQRLHMQNILDQKVQELEQLEKKLQEYATYTEELNNQNNDLKSTITSLKQNCKNLEENKSTLIFEMKNRDSKIEEIENIRKEVEFENNVFRQEKEKWLCDKDEKNVTLNDLQMQLENEVQFKIQLQKELNHSQKNNSSLLEDMTNLNLELSNLKQDVEIKNQTIVEMELNLEKEKNINEGLKTNYNRLQEEAQILTKEVNAKDIIIAEMQNTIEEEKKYFENEILKREKLLESEHQQLLVVLEEKNTIKAELTSVVNDKNTLEKTENHKCTEIMQLKEELKKMKELLEENKSNVSSEISAKKEIEQHLAQERANIDLLKQQVQTLQDELIKSCKTREDETQAMELVISEKQSQLNNLKYHIDEEIEEKNMVKIKFNDLISKLNTEINELQQKLKDDTEQSLKIIDTKVEEVKILQQEKLCLIQKLSDETTKRDSIIQSMKDELKRELNSKASMEEEYENQIIKLNETVSNTHNKVMELQKNISKNSEELEQVREALRKERQLNQDLTDKYYMELKELNKQKMHTDNILEQKVVECEQFQKELQQSVAYSEELNKNVSDLKMTIFQLNENCKILEDNKLTLLLEVKDRDAAVEKNRKEIDNTNTKWLQDKDENNVTINALQMQLKNELFIKMQLQKELTDLQKVRGSLLSDINLLNLEHTKIKKEIENTYQTINEKEQQLKEERLKNEKLKTDHEELQEKVRIISQDITTKDIALKVVKEEKTSYEDEILKKDALLEFEQQKLLDVLEEKSAVQAELISVMKEKVALEKDISQKGIEVLQLKEEYAKLMQILEENRSNTDNKLLDVTKELEVSKENCQQLSTQLKRIVHQKNEEIAELKKQVSKMSVTENRATQIIKVSSKYQAIILKRIAEIKNNTVLKELTNFGNSANCDNEVRRSLYAGTITMEDLENFLETTEKHLRRCSEKQIALQKERDRLTDVNRINESEVINLKKFLTELAVGYKTFCNIKDLYSQKLSRIVTVQRTVRREILNLDGRITEATMCKLERGYAAVMQDLSECSLNMQRWVERSIDRTISPEKIQQAFPCDNDRVSLASMSFQNNSLDIQLEEMEKSFQRLLEEVLRAQKGEGAKDAQSVTMMEIRAEYEDKLNRMKAKMKELYHEQIAVFQSRQKEEIAALEHELQKSKQKLLESSRAYEEHIKSLTTELWTVGEKFLMKQDEAEWLRKKQRYGSLMSLQHVHSSGLMPTQEVPSRPSDTHSLRSLPAFNNNTNGKREGRGLHMSDEEGEVFDNRCLKELSSTPRRSPPPGLRLSELRWRNSLCPPHLKSSYPAETQFASAIDEDDIKCSTMINGGGRPQRKEVGITAYKKPGPPTPSKQAGRLSATDSELRESLRVEMDPQAQASRKTSTPSRFRAFFRSARHDISDGTPRKRSSIFRKK